MARTGRSPAAEREFGDYVAARLPALVRFAPTRSDGELRLSGRGAPRL